MLSLNMDIIKCILYNVYTNITNLRASLILYAHTHNIHLKSICEIESHFQNCYDNSIGNAKL